MFTENRYITSWFKFRTLVASVLLLLFSSFLVSTAIMNNLVASSELMERVNNMCEEEETQEKESRKVHKKAVEYLQQLNANIAYQSTNFSNNDTFVKGGVIDYMDVPTPPPELV